MSTLNDCCSPCASSVAPVNIVGPQGNDGTPGIDGVDGLNAFTTVASPFFVPATTGIPVTIQVVNSDWIAVGQYIVIGNGPAPVLPFPGPATFVVTAVGVAAFTATWVNAPGDVAGGTQISAGNRVSPSGFETRLVGVAALTDNTGGTAGNIIAAGVGISTVTWHFDLVNFTTGDDVTDYTVGYAFKILSVDWVTTTPATGAAHATAVSMDIAATPVTGGVVSLTSANTATKGVIVPGTAITANNIGTATGANSIITIRAVESNHFVDGDGSLIVRIQNLDTRDAFTSLIAKLNPVIAALS